jgi:hypothetical protein
MKINPLVEKIRKDHSTAYVGRYLGLQTVISYLEVNIT